MPTVPHEPALSCGEIDRRIARREKRQRRRRIVQESHLPPVVDPERLTNAERKFLHRALARKLRVYRRGWPDFLVERGGKLIGVEVKDGVDTVSRYQAKMFAALEKHGIVTYVWHQAWPNRLIPWRRYLTMF